MVLEPGGQANPGPHPPAHDELVKPSTTLKVPLGHGTQLPRPPALYVPAGQMAAVALAEPAGHAYPGTHGPLHAAEVRPEVLPKRPLGQSGHEPTPPLLYLPGPHSTAVGLVDPAGHAYPAAQ